MGAVGRSPAIDVRRADTSLGPGLGVVTDLLDRLHRAGVRYCHWKSNEHADAAVQGLTDLDVLVEPRRSAALAEILAQSGFIRFQATAFTAYPAVEDYLAHDRGSGRLVHLHLHYRLTLGEAHLKGYRLPWEEEVLATRTFDEANGLYVSNPEMEMLLLLVRDALKRKWRDRLPGVRGRPAKGDLSREFEWLLERVDAAELTDVATRLVGPDVEEPLRDILHRGLGARERKSFAAAVRPVLSRHRSYNSVVATMLAGSRRILWILGGLSRRRFHWAVPLRRVSPRGGICIAFLGSDGAGKSTVSSDTVAWLSQKLDVVPIYFGSGDGPSSVLRYPFLLARRAFDRGKSSADPVRRRSGVRGGLRSIAAVPWALSLSLEKRSKLRRMVRARNRGMIVVCDRFPQNQIANINDGPLLGRLSQSKWGIARALSRWEAVPYAEVQHETPDIVIKLVASPGVALSRRPEMTAEEIETRIGIVRSLRYPETVRVVEVDSDLPLEDVIGSVRSAIWAEL